jgi:hypothetical protein
MTNKELPLVALFGQEKLVFLFTRISTTIGAKAVVSKKDFSLYISTLFKKTINLGQ